MDLRKEKDKPKKQRKKTASKLKKELDKIFSLYVRQKAANKQGQVKCYTCGAVKNWKEIQAGHLVSRSYLATRYSEANVRPQCVGCNVFGGGKVPVFASRLAEEIGESEVAALFRKAQEIVKNFPYEAKIEEYKAKLAAL